VGPDSDMIDTDKITQIADMLDVICQAMPLSGIAVPAHEAMNGRSDRAAFRRHPLEQLVALVARRVGDQDGRVRAIDDLVTGTLTDMAEIDRDTQAIHLRDCFCPKGAQPTLFRL